jgi:hypothetical protein
MKIRQGRKNKHNLYLQVNGQPGDNDPSIGYIRDPKMAAILVAIVNGAPVGVVRDLQRSFVVDATWERSEELRVDRLGPSEEDVQNDDERPESTFH